MYAHHAARIDGHDVEKVDGVMRARRARREAGQDQRDLEELYLDEEEEYPTFEGFEVDPVGHRGDHVPRDGLRMYLRDGWLPSAEEAGGRRKKKKKKGNKKK